MAHVHRPWLTSSVQRKVAVLLREIANPAQCPPTGRRVVIDGESGAGGSADPDICSEQLASIRVSLPDQPVDVDLAFTARSADELRQLKIDQLEARGRHGFRAERENLPHPDVVKTRMIGLLLEVPDVLVVIVAPVFGGDLEAAVRRHPPRKDFRKLIVGQALTAVPCRQPRVAGCVVLEVRLQERLKNLGEIAPRNSGAWPDGMKESRATDLESGDASRLPDYHEAGREPLRSRFCSTDVSAWSSNIGEIRLSELTPHELHMKLPNENVQRLTRSEEDVREPRRVVAEEEWIVGARTPRHVGRRDAKRNNWQIHADGALAGIDLRIGSVTEALRKVYAAPESIGKRTRSRAPRRDDVKRTVLRAKGHRRQSKRCWPPSCRYSRLNG